MDSWDHQPLSAHSMPSTSPPPTTYNPLGRNTTPFFSGMEPFRSRFFPTGLEAEVWLCRLKTLIKIRITSLPLLGSSPKECLPALSGTSCHALQIQLPPSDWTAHVSTNPTQQLSLLYQLEEIIGPTCYFNSQRSSLPLLPQKAVLSLEGNKNQKARMRYKEKNINLPTQKDPQRISVCIWLPVRGNKGCLHLYNNYQPPSVWVASES